MEFQLRDKSILGFIKRNLHLGFEDQQKWNDLRVSLVYQTFNLEFMCFKKLAIYID